MRQFDRVSRLVTKILALGLGGFHLYTGIFGVLPEYIQRPIHVALAISLVFLTIPARRSGGASTRPPWWDWILIMAIMYSCGYMLINFERFFPFMVERMSVYQMVLSVVTAVVILESGRRTIGWIFPVLTALGFAYTVWGHYTPGLFGFKQIALAQILQYLYLGGITGNAIFGFLTGLSATYIALFIIFGAILLTTGGGKTFIDIATLVAGRFRGGPAKIAVVSSAFVAMLSGSSVANVATTGTFTIPMMKKLGYSSHFAGGVEATASTGGMITPPIMGAAAFIMAEFLSIPYLKVALAAAIPSLLFYVAVFMGVHFQAVRMNLRPVPREEMPSPRSVLTYPRLAGIILPVGALLYTLLAGYSLTTVSAAACVVALVVYIFGDLSPRRIWERTKKSVDSLEVGARTVMMIAPVLICANMVLFFLTFTGADVKFSHMAMRAGEANLLLAMIFTGILVMLLGTSLPATAAYVLGVVVAAPLLEAWGIAPLAAHMFIFYYSIIASITPPVCPAVFMAVGIAKSSFLKTAWVAIRLSPLLYLMPFVFTFDPTLIGQGPGLTVAYNTITAAIGAIVLISGTMGQFITKANIFEIVLLLASGLLLLLPGWQTDLPGAVIAIAIGAKQLWQWKKMRQQLAKQ